MKYLLLAMMVLISHNLPAVTVTATSTRDDVEQEANGNLISSAQNLRIGAMDIVALTFQNITIPSGKSITSANITFTARRSDSNAAGYTISIGSQTDSGEFGWYEGGYPSQRPKASATVTWTPTAWVTGQTYQTADISSLVQHLGTITGGQIDLYISGTGERWAGTFDSGAPAALTIEYGEVVEPPPVDVPVPTGLVIDPGEFGPYTKAFHIWEAGKVGPVLTWDASQHAVSYRVELRDIEKGAVALLGTTVNASWTLTFPAPGLYELMVTAIGADAKESETTFSGAEWVVYVRPAAVGNVGVE